jgi:hypothetical protein
VQKIKDGIALVWLFLIAGRQVDTEFLRRVG